MGDMNRIVVGITCPKCGSLVRIGSAFGQADDEKHTYEAGCVSVRCNYYIEVTLKPGATDRDISRTVKNLWTIESLREL